MGTEPSNEQPQKSIGLTEEQISMTLLVKWLSENGLKVINTIGWTSAVVLAVIVYQFYKENKQTEFINTQLVSMVRDTSEIAASCKAAIDVGKDINADCQVTMKNC